jgi:hypothetical protein
MVCGRDAADCRRLCRDAEGTASKPFVGTRWEVILELPLAGEQPSFRFGDGRMEGFAGCNRVNARYVQDTVGARAIVIGRIETG